MRLLNRFTQGELRLTRIEAFSDGVFAIIVTLLVLDWLNHHHILGLARHADYGMVWLNSIFLMGQSFIPFPTALLGEYAINPLAASFFGCVFALNTVLFIALQAYIMRRLIKPELVDTEDPFIIRKSLIGPALYLLGAVAAWFSVYAAFAIYLITPLFFITPPQTVRENSH